MANVAAFLASEEGTYVTGSVFVADGAALPAQGLLVALRNFTNRDSVVIATKVAPPTYNGRTPSVCRVRQS